MWDPTMPTAEDEQTAGEGALQALTEMIRSQQVRPGDRLPPERQLAESLGFSRNTLREGIRALEMMRVLEVRPGRGIYVSSLEPGVLLQATAFVTQPAALFVMIGADPHTDWLPGSMARDRPGFILTGRDLPGGDSPGDIDRLPLPLETSMPGVFAVGDVRAGSVKRVASAVGEGSVAIPQVHQHLRYQATPSAN